MSSNNEMILKVKLVSDNTNPYPSPITGTGTPGRSSTPGSAGSASPIVSAESDHQKRMKEHSDALNKLTDHITKASVGFAMLAGSSSSFAKGLEKAANVLAALSVAGSGVGAIKSLFTGSTWKAIGGALTNPGTLLAGGAAVGAASIGYGLYHGQEDGTSYFGGFNQWRANTFGGGKVNSRGQWISQDQQIGTIHHQFLDRMRRDEMQSPIDSIKMEGRESKYAMLDQMHDIRMHGMSYKGYAGDAHSAEREHRKLFDDNLASSRNLYESVYGKEIGGMMAQRDLHGTEIQSQLYGDEKAGVMREQREVKSKGSALQWKLARAHSNYNEAADARDADMKANDYKTNTMLEEHKNILRINDDIKKNKLEQLEIDKKMSEIANKGLAAKKADTEGRLANARDILTSATQSLEGMKQSYGMMDVGDQQYMKDVAGRFKHGGIEAITPEERSMMQNSPLGEDIRRQAIERAGKDPGFAEMLRGSRLETNMNKASDQVRDYTKLAAEIKTQINAKVELDPQNLAKSFMEAMVPFISKVTVAMDRAVNISTERATNDALRTAYEKAPKE